MITFKMFTYKKRCFINIKIRVLWDKWRKSYFIMFIRGQSLTLWFQKLTRARKPIKKFRQSVWENGLEQFFLLIQCPPRNHYLHYLILSLITKKYNLFVNFTPFFLFYSPKRPVLQTVRYKGISSTSVYNCSSTSVPVCIIVAVQVCQCV